MLKADAIALALKGRVSTVVDAARSDPDLAADLTAEWERTTALKAVAPQRCVVSNELHAALTPIMAQLQAAPA